jgi:hypothetical protein
MSRKRHQKNEINELKKSKKLKQKKQIKRCLKRDIKKQKIKAKKTN